VCSNKAACLKASWTFACTCVWQHSLVKQRINAGVFCKEFAQLNVAKSEETTSASICVGFSPYAKAPSIISDFRQINYKSKVEIEINGEYCLQ
jgi:hypothetical protein